MGGWLYAREVVINDKLTVCIPTVAEIIESEKKYYSYYDAVKTLVATPLDYMVQLDDAGVDFNTLSQYDLFLILFRSIKERISLQNNDNSIKECEKIDPSVFRMIFKNIDFLSLNLGVDLQNKAPVLINDKNEVIIDRSVYRKICQFLHYIHYIQPDRRKAGNEEARRYMIERARIKQQRASRRIKNKHSSQIEDLIVALVNTEQFKYNYESTKDLTIYQFNTSLHQIINKMNYDNIMTAYYSGTVDISKISQDELNWLSINNNRRKK